MAKSFNYTERNLLLKMRTQVSDEKNGAAGDESMRVMRSRLAQTGARLNPMNSSALNLSH